MQQKKLVKSRDRVLAGVCGGIAEFIGWPKEKVRILWVICTLFGLGILVYVILAFVMPNAVDNDDEENGFDIDDYRVE